MPFKALLYAKLPATVAAPEGLQPRVDPFVLQEPIFSLEVLPAYEAEEGPGVGVDALVADHIAVLTEGATTHLEQRV